MNESTSHCLDVHVGFHESIREDLITFLVRTGAPFGATKAERGRMNGVKILRVWTPDAEALQQHIASGMCNGDDNNFEVHHSEVDASRCMNFLPDYNHPLGHGEFSLLPPRPAVAAEHTASTRSVS